MISVVIPNFNGAELLRKNLPRILELLKQSEIEHELIIVDDASTDDSIGVLEDSRFKIQDLRIIKREKNGGFPIAVNNGFLEAKGEVVFVIKNDTVPENVGYFTLLLEHFKDPPSFAKASAGKKVFAVSSALKTKENEVEEMRGQGRIVFFRGMFLHFRRKDEYEKWLETTRYGRNLLSKKDLHQFATNLHESGSHGVSYSAWADGGSSAYNKELYFKIGGFDQVYRPGYWEDTDLGYRAWKAGYKVDFEPKAVLIHDFEAGVYKKKYGERKIRLINLRNQFIFTWKNADFSNLLKFFQWEIYNHLAAIKSGNMDFIKAYWMALFRLPEIVKGRIFQKKINKLSDSEVLRVFQ